LHDGKIQWTGPINEMDTSEDPFLSQFINGRADGPIESVR
ncbi:MAG: ABC transporter ATP-binding protein, partial [Pseudoruegeria sp.]